MKCDKTATLSIHHTEQGTGDIESDKIDTRHNIIGTDKKIGVRQIGIWSDTDYTRHLWLLFDFKGDNHWEPVIHWSDRGQYTVLVRKTITGAFKSPPPYRDYPYGEESAKTTIVLGTATKAYHTWCRQINASKDIHGILNSKVEDLEKAVIKAVKTIGEKIIGKPLWDSDATLKIDNPKIESGTYANDETNTILFASAIDAEKQGAMFGVQNGDAVWSGMDSRWYINHHILDSEVTDSTLEFNLLMGSADEIRIQLGNRSAVGWILDNDYVFGGYEFVISKNGIISARIEYYYGVNEAGVKTSSYSLVNLLGEIKNFNPTNEVSVKATIKNQGDDVIGILNIGGKVFQKVWKAKDWYVNELEVPKGRVDSKEALQLYKGVKHHWSIGRIRVSNVTDNGSLINKVRVYKL